MLAWRGLCNASTTKTLTQTRLCTVMYDAPCFVNFVVGPCRDDPDYADAIRIETALGIPVLRHDEKKPGGIAEVLAFFEGKDPEGGTVSVICFFSLGRTLCLPGYWEQNGWFRTRQCTRHETSRADVGFALPLVGNYFRPNGTWHQSSDLRSIEILRGVGALAPVCKHNILWG